MAFSILFLKLTCWIYINSTLDSISSYSKNEIIETLYPNLSQKSFSIGLCDDITDIKQFILLDKRLTEGQTIKLFNGFELEDSTNIRSHQYPIYIPGYIRYENLYYLIGLTFMDYCYYSSIITFNNLGEFLDIRYLGSGKCGPDFCFCCNEKINIINGDIFIDGFSRRYECNDVGILGKNVILNIYRKRIILGTNDYFAHQDIYNIDTSYYLANNLIGKDFSRERDCIE